MLLTPLYVPTIVPTQMASLTRKERSPYWYCCFTRPDGTRTKVSTKQTNRNDAMAVCLEWEQAVTKAGHGALTETQAQKVVSDIVERVSGQPLVFHTVTEWMRFWLKGKQQTRASSTYERYHQIVEQFIEFLGNRASLGVAHITPSDIMDYRGSLEGKGLSPKTCNLTVKIIGAALNAAKRQGLITYNPVEALDPLPHEAITKKPFTHEQVGDLLQKAPGDWRGAILAGYYTGQRLRDVANIRWSAIDLTQKQISLMPQKTKRSKKWVIIPLHPRLEEEFLEMAGQDDPDAFLFPSLAGKPTGGAHGLSMAFSRIMAAAGIDARMKKPPVEGRRAVSQFSYHSLRHSFNSTMANNGVPTEVRQLLTGHSSEEMNKVYTHHEWKVLRTAVEDLPKV